MGEGDLELDRSDHESQDSDSKHSYQHEKDSFSKKKTPTEPDNKYYEVEAILDGPKKRREHLFKVCYKVRWKGYGPESDTWQPIADLVNVQDMIDDYKKEKDNQRHDKFKKTGTDSMVNKRSRISSSSSSPEGHNAGRKHFDPVYGTVKDKFWKDLELGHQNHSPQFNGDMYSNVKGCRRAAHTEALASIHKQRRRESKSLHTSRSPLRVLRGDHFSKSRSSSPVSSKHGKSSRRSESPKMSRVGRPRKRSTDPLFASESTSAKRSRRSREANSGNIFFECKQPSVISSVTSETVAIVTTSTPLTPPVVSNTSAAPLLSASSVVSLDGPVSSSVVTAWSRSSTDSTCLSMVNVGASSCDAIAGASFDTCGGASQGSLPDDSQIHKALSHMRSALDTQSEASGAVERSYDAECLWNGACNRSDCKSNRRRNMKNGQRKLGGVIPTDGSDSDGEPNVGNENTAMEDENNDGDSALVVNEDQAAVEEDNRVYSSEGEEMEDDCLAVEHTQNISSAPSASGTKSSLGLMKTSTSGAKSSHSVISTSYQSRSSSRQDDSPSPLPVSTVSRKDHKSLDYPSSGHGSRNKSSSQSHSSARDRRLLYSSCHTDSSDSSFDDTASSGPSLSREAVSDSFCRIARLSDVDTSAVPSTSGSAAPGSWSLQRSLEGCSSQGRKSHVEAERPGLFSENNGAFIFLEQDSGDMSTREQYEEGVFSQESVSVTPSSPGKENFGSSGLKSKLKVTKGADVPSTHSGGRAGSLVRSHPRQTRLEDLEASASRPRSSEVSQPQEKMPSPNSRDSELNERIVTLTCDELEDFVEQNITVEKDIGFISNADLLQAVNLSKAEVVKRAVKQIRSNEHKLDLEQADNTGTTLLMRAVQRGALAIVEMLLENGANVNAQQTNGTTALMIAADTNGTCLVALLLKYGANSSLYTVNSDQAETALMK
ncbi:unnamed protein product, partial [Candidula unifasciata]